MRLIDIAAMACHNLWSRKSRTAMNLFGIVLGCVVLCMTFAGTRGMDRSLREMLNNSESARRFMIGRGYESNQEPPAEVLNVEGEMSEERRERIRQRLKETWLRQNAGRTVLAQEQLQQLSQIPHLVEVVPEVRLQCELKIEMSDRIAQRTGYAIGISTSDRRTKSRILFGEPLEATDRQGVLLSEYAAYELGFRSDDQLRQLVNQPIDVRFRLQGQRIASFLQFATNGQSDNSDVDQTLAAIQELVENIDATPLTSEQKQRVRKVFKPSGTSHDLLVTKKCAIRGIFRASDDKDLIDFARIVYVDDRPDIYLPGEIATELELSGDAFESFHAAIGAVDKLSNLEAVIEQVESNGWNTHSVLWLMKWIENDIDNVRIAVSALSLLVLFISAIGISNTMIVSVLERTGEFGILKSIGARDRHILILMLMEGVLMGVAGAIAAVTISIGISKLFAIAVRNYITQQMNGEFTASVFAFSAFDVLLVLCIATVVCAVASVFPAYRAARLDPVVAMRR